MLLAEVVVWSGHNTVPGALIVFSKQRQHFVAVGVGERRDY